MFTRDELLEAINKMIDNIDNNVKNVNVWYSRYKSTYYFETTKEACEALFDNGIFRF